MATRKGCFPWDRPHISATERKCVVRGPRLDLGARRIMKKSKEFQDILANTRRGKNGAYHLQATVYQDNNPMRPDENTVDPDKESLALYENYVQQLAMYNKIGDQFSNLRYAFNQFTK